MSVGIGSLLSAAASLAAVLLLVAAGARLLRGQGLARPGPPGAALLLRGTVALDARRRLHLVQCGARQVVLLTGGTQDIVVGWIEPQA